MTMNWIVTLPKTIEWEDYQKELDSVADGQWSMRYRVPNKAKVEKGDKLFITWRGRVRGWMLVTDFTFIDKPWNCLVTDKIWPPGWYVVRSGYFHKAVHIIPMKGFRGIRRFMNKYWEDDGADLDDRWPGEQP